MRRLATILKTIMIMTGLYFVLYYLDYRAIHKDAKEVKRTTRRWF